MFKAILVFILIFFVVSTIATFFLGMIGFRGLDFPYIFLYKSVTLSYGSLKYGFASLLFSFFLALFFLWLAIYAAYSEYKNGDFLKPSEDKTK